MNTMAKLLVPGGAPVQSSSGICEYVFVVSQVESAGNIAPSMSVGLVSLKADVPPSPPPPVTPGVPPSFDPVPPSLDSVPPSLDAVPPVVLEIDPPLAPAVLPPFVALPPSLPVLPVEAELLAELPPPDAPPLDAVLADEPVLAVDVLPPLTPELVDPVLELALPPLVVFEPPVVESLSLDP